MVLFAVTRNKTQMCLSPPVWCDVDPLVLRASVLLFENAGVAMPIVSLVVWKSVLARHCDA